MKTYKVSGDGNCMFNSIAFGMLYYTRFERGKVIEYKPLAKVLRKIAIEYMKSKIETNNIYKQSLALTYSEEEGKRSPTTKKQFTQNAKAYVKRMSQCGEWGGEIELTALQKYVHQSGFKGVRILGISNSSKRVKIKTATNINNTKMLPIINIVHDGIHFNFVDLNLNNSSSSKSSKSSGLIKASKKSKA